MNPPDPWGPSEPIPPPELATRERPVESTPPPRDHVEFGELRTDLGNARRIIAKAKGNVRWSAALPGAGDLGGYAAWNGKRWAPDSDGIAHRLAKNTARDLFTEACDKHGDDRTKAMTWAMKSQSAGGVAAAMRLARTEPEMKVGINDFDANGSILNTASETVDLPKNETYPHRKSDLMTKITRAKHDPHADAPTFYRFLERVQPDPLVRAYLQRWVGYCLSGDTSEQAFAIHHGSGANGKTTFWETIVQMMGDYAATTPFSTFTMKRDGDSASNDIAALNGARLVMASEPEQGVKLKISLVKQLTGGESITARFLYKEHFTYTPTFKIVLVTNHRPGIDENGHTIWRRIHFVPWPVTIPDYEQVAMRLELGMSLNEKLLTELPGILNWAIDGYAEWKKHGLLIPDSLTKAKDDYRDDEDSFGSFLDERCHVDANDRSIYMKAGQLLVTYSEWAKANGADPLSAKGLAARLSERGLSHKKMAGIRTWFGIRLRDRDDDIPGTT